MHTGELDIELTAGPMLPVPENRYGVDMSAAPGEHLWIMSGAWRISDPASAFDAGVPKFLDLENLLTIVGPGCYICEQVYTAEVAAKPCPGEP